MKRILILLPLFLLVSCSNSLPTLNVDFIYDYSTEASEFESDYFETVAGNYYFIAYAGKDPDKSYQLNEYELWVNVNSGRVFENTENGWFETSYGTRDSQSKQIGWNFNSKNHVGHLDYYQEASFYRTIFSSKCITSVYTKRIDCLNNLECLEKEIFEFNNNETKQISYDTSNNSVKNTIIFQHDNTDEGHKMRSPSYLFDCLGIEHSFIKNLQKYVAEPQEDIPYGAYYWQNIPVKTPDNDGYYIDEFYLNSTFQFRRALSFSMRQTVYSQNSDGSIDLDKPITSITRVFKFSQFGNTLYPVEEEYWR